MHRQDGRFLISYFLLPFSTTAVSSKQVESYSSLSSVLQDPDVGYSYSPA